MGLDDVFDVISGASKIRTGIKVAKAIKKGTDNLIDQVAFDQRKAEYKGVRVKCPKCGASILVTSLSKDERTLVCSSCNGSPSLDDWWKANPNFK